MSTLTGNKISLTYKSLIKTSDNDVLTGALKELSDGLGNNSGVFLNTGGDLKSTGTLEFSNFKATAYAVTINKLVNEADGISNNDNDTSLPTSAAVKDYVDTHVTSQDLDFSDGTNPGAVDLDSQVFAIVGTSNEIETSASGQQLQIGLPNDVTISGTYTGTTFSGDLNGTINTATTAVTQTAGDNSTKVATTAYVDTLDAASDLDFSDGSVNSAVNLNTQVFSIQGTSNEITTTASGQSLTIALDSTGVDLPDGSTAITQTAGDNSTKVATTAYVDVLDAASDLDIAGDTGTGDVNLNTQIFTLSGTTNQVITAVSGQEATFSLPSTVHRNLQGNVTGDLTGNADTATAWETARDLILSSEATGTISNVDGTQNVTGAVTLLNSAVTGKVLTGLPTPAAGNIQSSDTILEAFGKLQSQVSSISNGLIFKGSWDAATNTPTLTSGGGEVDSGTTTGQTAFKLIETGQNFNTTVTIGDKVINQVDGTTALVTVIDSNTQLTLDADIMLSGEAYTIDASPFIPQGNYYVVNYAGTTNLNGITDWSIGDWVIADADNRWSKLDHSQVDGQGTPGHLPVFATATTIGDSIVAQSGTALTVTGSLNTTLGASVTGDFAVNTNKFTVAAASGIVSTANDIFTAQNKGIFFNGASDFSSGIAGTSAGQGVRIFAGGSAKVIIDSSGRVGIGTTSPNAKLEVVENINFSTVDTFGQFIIKSTGGSTGNMLNFGVDETNNFGFIQSVNRGSSTTNLILQRYGHNVGIGTDNPNAKLHIQTDAAPTDIYLTDGTLGTDNYGGVIRGYSVTGQGGRLQLGTLDNDIYYPALTVLQQGGNVGIGTDSPDTLLEIVGADPTLTIRDTETAGASTNATLRLAESGASSTLGNYYDINFTGSGALRFLYKVGTNINESMRIDSSGNVGIGTDDPDSYNLGSTGKTLAINSISASVGSLLNMETAGAKRGYLFANSANVVLSAVHTGIPLKFNTEDTTRLTIDSSGNSTFEGNVTLEGFVSIDSAATGSPYIDFKQDGTQKAYIQYADSTDALTLQTDGQLIVLGGSTETFKIDTSNNATFAGNVGIGGAASSTHTLDLNSSSNLALRFYDSTTFKAGMQAVDTGGQMIATSSANDFAIRSQSNMLFSTGGNTERMRIDSSGNVGIGTDSPNSNLTIQNNASNTNTRLIQLFHNNVTANGYVTIGAQYTSTNRYVESEIRFGSETLNGACSYLGFVTGCRNDGANTEKMRITSGGNVGIRNTNPGASLEVNAQGGGVGGYTGFKMKYGTSSVQSLYMGQVTAGNGAFIGTAQYRNGGFWQTEGTASSVINMDSAGNMSFFTNSGLTANTDFNVTERMKIKSDGDVVFNGGIFLGGTAAANRLDDYEEGTWTPEVSAPTTGSGVTYNYRGGTYVRIGNKCWVRMGLNVSSVGTGFNGVLYVLGLPFTAANVGPYQEPTAGANGGRWVTASNAGNVYAFVQNGTTQFVFRTMTSNSDLALDYSQLQGGNAGQGTWFTLQCFYEIA